MCDLLVEIFPSGVRKQRNQQSAVESTLGEVVKVDVFMHVLVGKTLPALVTVGHKPLVPDENLRVSPHEKIIKESPSGLRKFLQPIRPVHVPPSPVPPFHAKFTPIFYFWKTFRFFFFFIKHF